MKRIFQKKTDRLIDIQASVVKFYSELASNVFPENVDALTALACKIDRDVIDVCSSCWIRAVATLRNFLDLYVMANLEKPDMLNNMYCMFTKFEHDIVMVFCTELVRRVAVNLSNEFRETYGFLNRFFGVGDVLGSAGEMGMFLEAKARWNNEE